MEDLIKKLSMKLVELRKQRNTPDKNAREIIKFLAEEKKKLTED